ncbi:MORC family CW-type zinc finger protein 3-like isoform 2-T2 [Clarias gariepinus]|uniref:MORC family CW-type zinc finger protein 3-like isoform X2 n=1 Tax=Clarias gariepinus TaxID=13013 RepID=UPI00234D6800|nr:MORC family CW-type zinc finger protein 3-like isoform X2 [Clarias gariepinus]
MASLTNRKIPLSLIHPHYLHTNSTSHIWPFSAVAGLIDNAYDPDVSAKQFWISKTMIQDQACLVFMDNGKGMDYDKMYKMLSFGFNDKQTVGRHIPVGQYGNSFKSGSMRLGKDALVFSQKANTMCVGLLSQTYHEKIKAEHIIVPIVKFTVTGENDVSVAPEYEECLHDILKYSLFNTKEDLLYEFSAINWLSNKSKSGTRIIVWNLRRTSLGELELDFKKDRYDFQILTDVYGGIKETNKQQARPAVQVPKIKYSLRAYCSILYLKPKMQIIIQGQKVETQYVTKNLELVFKDTYKPVCNPPLKKPIKITFGYSTKSGEPYGIMMYHKNRLIRAYDRVGCQRRINSTGVGVIGVIECNHLTPTHNMQDFDNTDEYRRTMLDLGTKLEDYWKETWYRFKQNVNRTEPFEDFSTRKPDQTWIQCYECLKWRKLPDGVGELHKKWFCKMNPDNQFRSCEAEEEPEDSDDEQRGYQKTYRQEIKVEEVEADSDDEQCEYLKTYKQNRGTVSFSGMVFTRSSFIMRYSSRNLSCQTSSSSDIISSSQPVTGSKLPDIIFVDSQNTLVLPTPTRMKRVLDQNQESPAKKKARGKNVGTVQHSLSITRAFTEAYFASSVGLTDSGNEAQIKEFGISQMEDVNNDIEKRIAKKEQSNEFISISTEDEQTYKDQYLKAMEKIKQLQNEVGSLRNMKCTLLTSCESLQKDLEGMKKNIEKLKASVENPGVRTDFPSSHVESTATVADVSTFERGSDSQQHETHDKSEIEQEKSTIKLYSLRLKELRQKVARLLVTFIPALDLQQVNYDCEVIDEILTQVIEEKDAASS